MDVENGSLAETPLPPISSASTPQEALAELARLCADIQHFIVHTAQRAQYRAPIIDWHHADDYAQKDIAGLKKFLGAAEAERSYVEGLAESPVPPKDFTSNTPHILAVWYEFRRAAWPLTSIGLAIEYDDGSNTLPAANGHPEFKDKVDGVAVDGMPETKPHGRRRIGKRRARANVKVDIVCKGGDEWIKVNTMKESRLLQEFREQDSYINSDYESDTDTSDDAANASNCKAGLSTPPTLCNSLIANAQSLLHAANNVPLLPGRRRPAVRMIFTRLEPLVPPSSPSSSNCTDFEDMKWHDARTGRTLNQLARMGVVVQLGPTPKPATVAGPKVPLVPTRDILLDLSILVALCCESSHRSLPKDEAEHQARFRALRIVDDASGEQEGYEPQHRAVNGSARSIQRLELGPHSNASRDLSDQLAWEAQHPLIGELRDRLSRSLVEDEKVKFWVTKEVHNRLPGLVDLIGGPGEWARAKALFDTPAAGTDIAAAVDQLSLADGQSGAIVTGGAVRRNEGFWAGSRWEGQEGILADLRVGILPDTDIDDDIEIPPHPAPSSSAFGLCLIKACEAMFAASTSALPVPASADATLSSPQTNPAQTQPQVRRDRRNRHRPSTLSAHHTTRLPSGHTLRTLMHGAARGWTVLSNNRGAVGKVCREMGIGEGLSVGDDDADNRLVAAAEAEPEKGERAAVWIVNPSSLSEWRRREVEKENERVRAVWAETQGVEESERVSR